MNNNIMIYVIDETNNFINYLVYHNIKYTLCKKNKTKYYLIVKYNDYITISRRYKTSIIKYYGFKNIYNIWNNNKYMIISFIISLFLLYLLTNTIFEIDINTDDIILKNKIIEILKKNDIDIYKKKKSYEEIILIKDKMLKENDNILEWIEIKSKGCKYIIDLTPKVINNHEESNDVCDIIASHDGVIKHITVDSGTKIKEINEYVKKGDILISGNILKDDKLIKQVKSSGKVYAEVWYLSKLSIPFKYTNKVKTGNVINHYYIELFNKKFTLIGKYNSDNTINKKKLLVDKPYLRFKLYKEIKEEYKYEINHLSIEEALNEGIKKSEEYINNTLMADEHIISKNVLKKEVNSSKMYIEVFYKIYKSVGVTSKIKEIEKEELDEKRSNRSS